MKKFIAAGLTTFTLSTSFAIQDYHGLSSDEIHPNYDLMTIRPRHDNRDQNGNNLNVYPNEGNEFMAPTVGLEWHPDGDLLVLTWRGSSGPGPVEGTGRTGDHPRDGRLFKLSGVKGTTRGDITGELIADNFKDAHGLVVVDGEIYVGDIDRIVKLVDNNGDGFYETHETLADIPHSNGWFEYSYGPVYKDGKFYMALSNHFQLSGNPGANTVPGKGSIVTFDMQGNMNVVASGFREPNGITLGPGGEIFVTDNQGSWRPANMLTHVSQGRNYGYRPDGDEFLGEFFNEPVTPPTVWGVHGEIAAGPTGPAYMTTGLYKGQFFVGDIGRGGVKRYFVEKIKGEFQGGAVTFSGGLEVGIDRIVFGEDGTIYAGGVGNGGQSNQGWLGMRQGLQKFIPNGSTKFEILKVYNRAGGMEIEFTKPVYTQANQASLYTADHYTMSPSFGYGAGHKTDMQNLNISSVQVSTDRTRVFLAIPGLQTGRVVHLTIDENFASDEGESAWFHETWYTIHNLADNEPFSIGGCMQQNYSEYNPGAEYDDGSCTTHTSGYRSIISDARIRQLDTHINVILKSHANYTVSFHSIRGEVLYQSSGKRSHKLSTASLSNGIYFLSIHSRSGQQTQKILIQR